MSTLSLEFKNRLAFGSALLVISFGFFLVYINGLEWHEPRLGLYELMAGTAHRPFVYRVLVPTLIRLAQAGVPLPAEFYGASLIYLSLVGFALALQRLAAHFWPGPLLSYLVALAAIPALTPFTLGYRHIYDFSHLFLFTLCLAFLAEQRWRLLIPAYLLCCLSKETALFVPLIFLGCYATTLPRQRVVALALLQFGLYAGLRVILLYIFRNNPGNVLEYHWADQLATLVERPQFVVFHLVLAGFTLWSVLGRWAAKPQFLRRAALTLTPPLLLLYWLFGYPFEIRVFYEAFPIWFLLAVPTLGPYVGLNFFTPPPLVPRTTAASQ